MPVLVRYLTLYAALSLPLACAACQVASKQDRETPSVDSPQGNRLLSKLVFDRQKPGEANRTPVLSGISGDLAYRPGCLYINAGSGDETGLVVPAEVQFDGSMLRGKLGTPDGKPRVILIGEFLNLTGWVIDNPRDGRYSCNMAKMLIVDYF